MPADLQLAEILPATVRCVQTRTEHDLELFPAERAAVARAVASRQAEFATVRWCAREALAQLGVAPAPLVPGERGAPSWPATTVGSMTHCAGFRAAAVARSSEVASLGVDAEPDEPLPEGVAAVIASPRELTALPRTGDVAWDRLLFSAKESVYKAWFPLTRRFLEFDEVEAVIDPDGTFTAHLRVDARLDSGEPLTGFDGRWTTGGGLLATAVVVPASHPA